MSAMLKEFPAEPPGPENITLLVSPDREDHRDLKTMLEGNSWKVRGAHSCEEALRLLDTSQPPAVIACEKELPDGNWKDLFLAINRLRNPPPLIVLSRQADEFLWAEVLNLGGYDLLAKPLVPNEVHRVITMARRHGERAIAG